MRRRRIGHTALLGGLMCMLLVGMWTNVHAATPDPWVVVIGGTQSEEVTAVATDIHGNVYVTGTFRGRVDFDPGPDERLLTSDFAIASYIAKYNTFGDLVWVRAMLGDDDVFAKDIVVDHAGYIGVTGSFEGTADLDPGPGISPFTSQGSEDIFLIRVEPNGNLDWGFSTGAGDSDVSNAVTVDAFNDLYITGSFEGEVRFDPVPANIVRANDADDAFVARFTSFGRVEWVRQYGGDEDDEGIDIGVDANRIVYITGVFEDEIDLDAGFTADERTSLGKEDIFITLLEQGGNHRGALHIGGPGSERMPQVLVKADGSFYLTGEFSQTADFDMFTDEGTATSRGESDFFLAEYGVNRRLVWLYTNGSGRTDTSEAIGRDILGNLYITGAFEETVDFDPDRDDTSVTSLGQDDIYVASFTHTGDVREVRALRGLQDTESRDLSVDPTGNVIVAGNFQGTLDLGNGLTAEAGGSPEAYAGFVAKLSSDEWLPQLTTLYLPGLPAQSAPTN